MTDEDIVQQVRNLYLYESMLGQKFKANTYAFVADMLEMIVDIPEAIANGDVQSIKGIGPSTVSKINQLISEGKIDKLEAYKQRVPEEVLKLTEIEGVGPVTAYKLYNDLGVVSYDDLKAASTDSISSLPRMNSKVLGNINEFITNL